MNVKWFVCFKNKNIAKQALYLRNSDAMKLRKLWLELELNGPVRGNWPNYSKLFHNKHHCHLSYGYIVCWEVKAAYKIEIYYVGGRENAPY